jgi:hypothetical protein
LTGDEVEQLKAALAFLRTPLRILAMVVALVTLNLTGLASAQTRTKTFVSIGSGK